jgi:FMN-dependent NADH-azoreductase
MRILLLNSSPHGGDSHGWRLARELITGLEGLHSDGLAPVTVLERDLAAAPLPPIGKPYASALTSPRGEVALELMDVFDCSERLINEIEMTDVLIINTPMHNFTVPAALKLWIDHVLRIHRTFASTPEGKVGLMRDRPTFVLVGSGGVHTGDRARQPDFLTPYLRHALETIGIRDIHFVLLQGMVFGDEVVADALSGAREVLMRHAPFDRLLLAAPGGLV